MIDVNDTFCIADPTVQEVLAETDVHHHHLTLPRRLRRRRTGIAQKRMESRKVMIVIMSVMLIVMLIVTMNVIARMIATVRENNKIVTVTERLTKIAGIGHIVEIAISDHAPESITVHTREMSIVDKCHTPKMSITDTGHGPGTSIVDIDHAPKTKLSSHTVPGHMTGKSPGHDHETEVERRKRDHTRVRSTKANIDIEVDLVREVIRSHHLREIYGEKRNARFILSTDHPEMGTDTNTHV